MSNVTRFPDHDKEQFVLFLAMGEMQSGIAEAGTGTSTRIDAESEQALTRNCV